MRHLLFSIILVLACTASAQKMGDTLFSSAKVIATYHRDSSFLLTYFDQEGKLLETGRAYFNGDLAEEQPWEYFHFHLEQYLEEFDRGTEYGYDPFYGQLTREGEWESHDAETVTHSRYVSGIREGLKFSLNASEDTVAIGIYRAGSAHGRHLIYHPYGDHGRTFFVDTITYQEGRKHGPYVDHYITGMLKERGQYEGDLKSGEWLKLDPFGQAHVEVYGPDGEAFSGGSLLMVPRKSTRSSSLLTSPNGNFTLGWNGNFRVLYDLLHKRVVSALINVDLPSAVMGENLYYLSNNGQYIVSNYTDRHWKIAITPIIQIEGNGYPEASYTGQFIGFSPDGNAILYRDQGKLFLRNFAHNSQVSLDVDPFISASFSSDGKTIYLLSKNGINYYDAQSMKLTGSVEHDLALNEDHYLITQSNYDQTVILVFGSSKGKWNVQDMYRVDYRSKTVNEEKVPKVSGMDDLCMMYGVNCFTTPDGTSILVNFNCSDSEVPKSLRYLIDKKKWDTPNLKDANKVIAINSISEGIRFDPVKNEFVFDNLLNGESRTFMGLRNTHSFRDVSLCHSTLQIPMDPENRSYRTINLKDLSRGQVDADQVCSGVIDSTFYSRYDNVQRYTETIYFLEKTDELWGHNHYRGHRNKLFHLDAEHMVSLNSFSSLESILSFENHKKTERLEQVVYLIMDQDGDFVFFTPDKYYATSSREANIVFFEMGGKAYPFEQFDLKYNRPDIILDRLGFADTSLIAAYHQAYLKRLKKMGFSEDMLKEDVHLPQLEIKNFQHLPAVSDSSHLGLELRMQDSKYALDRINVWVNDVAVFGTEGKSLRELNSRSHETKLSIPLARGRNQVRISVLNSVGGESLKETVEVQCTAGKERPDLYLITIGVSEFEQSDYNLSYAAKDAKDIVSLFEKGGAYGKLFSKTLINQGVTRESVMELSSFLRSADINDEVMVFIAGHGVLDSKLDYYLATHDMDFKHPEKKGIAYEDLENLLDGIASLKKTLLIDACHSGEIDKDEVELAQADVASDDEIRFRAVGSTASPKLGLANTSELSKSLFKDLRKGTGTTVISSAGGMEFAMEGEAWSNGLFTYCLIEGIQTGAADLNDDKEIWLSELQQYVSDHVTELSKGKQQPTSRIENQSVDFRVW